jgi:L-amino acid N-acyltransferase YncA
LVCEHGRSVAGYAYASKFRPREAYQWTAEVTVYVQASQQRRGIGRALYVSLLEVLRLQGFRSAIAVIALPNHPSVRMHESLGFRAVGVFERVGYKLGRWHDVGWWQMALREEAAHPEPPRPIEALMGTPEWERALAAGSTESA